MGPIGSATSDAKIAFNMQRKNHTLQEKVDFCAYVMDWRSAAMVACHLKINESSVKDHCKNSKGNW